MRLYLESYGPATEKNLLYWLNEGLGAPRRHVMDWLESTDTTAVDLDGTPAYLLTEHRDEVEATFAIPAVRLLPGYDPWVMGPGTADGRLVPQGERGLLSRGANIVTVNGVVAGTWAVREATIAITWFANADKASDNSVSGEIDHLATSLGTDLVLGGSPDVRAA